jgi:type II secretory pathway pseudopilin PulG
MRSSLRTGERQGVSPPCNARSTRRADALPLAVKLRPPQINRSAFSLIEVIIATAILMGSAVVLARLAGMGRDQSQKARLYSEAQQLCEQTLNELLLGMRPVELVESMPLIPLPAPIEENADEVNIQDPFSSTERKDVEPTVDETNPEWRHSVRIEPLTSRPGMWALTVEVLQGDQTLPRPIRFSLTRWISGPPPEGAFDELMQGMEEPDSLQPGTMQSGGLL